MSMANEIGNEAKRKLAAGELVVAATLRQLRTPDAAYMLKACGFDAVIIDCEHGRMSADVVAVLCMSSVALGLTPIVRVASAAGFHIAEALDAGAQGVLVPHVDSAADAVAAVRHAKYPPLGTRSIAAVGPPSQYRSLPLPEFTTRQNLETMVLALVETRGGVASADAIAATDGIDGIMIGPNDLSADLGIVGKIADAQIRQAYATVAAACRAQRKHFVSGGVPGLDTNSLLEMGSRFIIGSTDTGYLMAAAQADVKAIRAAAMPPRE
jgi:2-keto-3-deoxy-L-rhamnonate aldolase RhmA